MAGSATPARREEHAIGSTASLAQRSLESPSKVPFSEAVRLKAAQLYGQGYKRGQIASLMLEYLAGGSQEDVNGRLWSQCPRDQRLRRASTVLRQWEKQQEFRDAIYDSAIAGLDMDIPDILRGVGKKAKRGRVDAARLALEVTGRHNPKGETVAPQVAVVINGVPRPEGPVQVEAVDAEAVDAEAVDAEEVEAVGRDED